ncbi:MAG: hypothetical protein RMI49_02100 [Candidatus Caldarchaeum sp.]|nr:hypothetical protein [Candidatus Caldarchaeum sp.]
MDVNLVVFSYSDLSHEELMHKASYVLSLGPDFMLLGPRSTMLKPSKKTVAVTALKTGSGKSTLSRHVVRILRELGMKPVVVRHPMPYGALERQVVQKFVTYDDLDANLSSLEEREEIEPHLRDGTVVYAGVDYGLVLEHAEKDGDVILWDGGNNDFPFFEPDLHITVVDASRPDLVSRTYPGETNLLMADVLAVHKADKTSPEKLNELIERLRALNPRAEMVVTASKAKMDVSLDLKGLRVVVVEDGPSLTHGGMNVGVAFEEAAKAGATIIDPKPYASGIIAEIYRQYHHIGAVVPSMGYTREQLADLEKTLNAVPADVIVSSSSADLSRILKLNKPVVRVSFEAYQLGGRPLSDIVRSLLLNG